MKNKKKRISYIRKPMPKQSFFSLAFAVVGLVCFGFSLGNSIVNQGSGGSDGSSLGADQPGVFCGGCDLRCENTENEGSQLHSGTDCTIVGGVLLFCWLGMLVIGVLTVI